MADNGNNVGNNVVPVIDSSSPVRGGVVNVNQPVGNISISNSSNASEFINSIFEDYNKFIASLSFINLILFTHITFAVFVLLCLSSITSVIFGDFLIKYFNLEGKFPKIVNFIQLRRKLQRYYLILNISLIFIASVTMISVDLFVLLT
jgi:hypothetical protein